ncbi:unnamed protein product [Onchocerca ochengi]|uniref:BZIP domain-containing protein n=1 Tax=Onchocerca ochengi TaxID=42157 RepID=A0A182EAK6_ONCOC|nr:unnamed protein product [Onchocerca ochengi]
MVCVRDNGVKDGVRSTWLSLFTSVHSFLHAQLFRFILINKKMRQIEMMNEQFCVVPFWGIPSPEANNLLSDCFIDCDDNNAAKTSARYSDSDSRLSTGYLLSEGRDDIPEWTFASKAMQNDEGRSSCSLESDSGSSCCGDSDISWLNEFMNIYGITTLDSNDDFNMKSADITVVTPQAKENHPAVVLTPMEEMKSSEVLSGKFALQFSTISKDVWMTSQNICTTSADPNISSAPKTNMMQKTDDALVTIHPSAVKVLHGSVHQKGGTVPPSHDGEKFVMKRTCFGGINERKREQNRCAAIRYRGKRREAARQKKQEQHELELRNVELKAEMNWLEKEVMYLKSLMKLTKSF